ncbi:hypothetical protein BCR34DRAFT_591447 [Clohesyomyces aquaticus]|uniref:Uncharacterized protein n=1 Tax=Clohesyomyces aquaticus TaxID=1231657 RepID=A0A1Y1Z0Q2_9PLEO|nr:hypothetical protein BCR34DRAFT_591447 [Clohesyomyces aquaticus]
MLESRHGLESVDENSGKASPGTEEDDSSSTDAGATDGESAATSATAGDTAASSTASTAGVKRSREADDICSSPTPKAIRRCRSHDVKGDSEPGVLEISSASTNTKRGAYDVGLSRSLSVKKLGRKSKLHDIHRLTLRDRKRKVDPDDEKFYVHSTKSRKFSKGEAIVRET